MESCCLCNESYDSDELIEVKDGLLKVKGRIVKLSEVISNVFCSSRVGHLETICTNCKGQIINFHNFKEKVKTNLEVEPQKIEILEEVKKFLYSSDEHLTVLKHDKSLSIVPTNTLNVVDISEDATSWTDEVLFEPSVENDSINLLQKPPIIAATNYQYTKNLESRQFKRKRDGISPSS